MRVNYVDKAKGLGILLVVWGHVSLVFFREIYAFHMPLFFFIAGFFFSVKSDFFSFFKKKLKSLMIPFMLFCTFTQIFYFLLLNFTGRHFSVGWNVIWDFLPYDNELMNTPLWFFYALFWMSIFYYFLRKYVKSNSGIFFIALGLYFLNEALKANDILLPFFLNRSIGELIYMHLGFYCYNVLKFNDRNFLSGNYRTLLSLIFFLIAFYFCFIIKDCGGYWNLMFGIPTAFFGLMSIVVLSRLVRDKFGILAYLGRSSLVIFSIHLPLLEFARPLSKRLFLEGNLCYDMMTFLLVLAFTFILGEMFKTFFPKYLGDGIFKQYQNRIHVM